MKAAGLRKAVSLSRPARKGESERCTVRYSHLTAADEHAISAVYLAGDVEDESYDGCVYASNDDESFQ